MQRNNSDVINNYEEAVIGLLMNKPFFARLIMSMRKDFNFPIPTCGVSVESKGIMLHINPMFFNSLSTKERIAVLEHEVLHCIHSHILRFKGFKVGGDKMLANIACDIAINQYIPDIPKEVRFTLSDGKEVTGRVTLYEDVVKEMPDLLPKESAEYYFNRFKKEIEDNPQYMQGKGTVDDHDEWEKSDLTEEQQESYVKKHIKAVYDGCSEEERKCVDQTLIEKMFASEIDWKAQLRAFFANSVEIFRESTRKKRNRRYGLYQPGSRVEAKLNLVVAVDTSGSVSDESLNKAFTEIDRMMNDNTIIHVIEADCVIHKIYEYKKGMVIKAYGRGATAYIPAIQKAKELDADALIYIGDGDSADVPEKPRIPVLWVMVQGGEPPVNFGKKIYLK